MTWEKKLEFDLIYLEKITFVGDWRIIFGTVGKVFARDGISEEGMDTAEDLGDYLLRTGRVDREEYDARQLEAKAAIQNRRR